MAASTCFKCNRPMEPQRCWSCGGTGKQECDGDVGDCEICCGRGGWNACVNLGCETYDARLLTEKIPPCEENE